MNTHDADQASAAGKTVPLRRPPWPFMVTKLPAAGTPTQPPLKPYIVLIGPRKSPRLRLHVMARSSFEAQQQHAGLLADATERMEVRRVRCTDPEASGDVDEHDAGWVDESDDSGPYEVLECRHCGASWESWDEFFAECGVTA